MAGHSKWANIQYRKGRQDAKRGRISTRLIREITVAARLGGPSIDGNPRLRLAVEKARDNNLTNEAIERAIKRGAGEQDGAHYESVRYEGYGVGGAAVIVDCLTDNRTRTVAEVRHAFSKHGGNLGTDGSVAYQFKHCGVLLFPPGTDEARLMEVALEAGADDILTEEDGSIEVITPPYEFARIKEALIKAGLQPAHGEVTWRPDNQVVLTGADAERMQKLLDALDECDDVQEVYTSAVLQLG
ncbi:MAG: YebC/PmpR family DNA-binding transcriptional regulator [Casimicrobiaceae bacterium]|nr:YebC/PmpR family DNA-binding transcriptional regulator [Casimicrobiaceae bacterium]MCX8097458.1 YebC/PmpR family DNA-binding transcriptional regulator [Casimicrobiaceae bacterium]MDW8311176.1 YebC/PmpR family DNA-binding transcriptional regulator [Burkholderiales bacterium]